MKSILYITIMVVLCSCSTWHYNHPRVSVEKQTIDPVEEPEMLHATSNGSGQTMPVLNANDQLNSTPEIEANATNDKVVDPQKPVKKSLGYHPVIKKSKQDQEKGDHHQYEKKKVKDQVLGLKQIEKGSVLTGWLRWMILLFCIGIILIIMGAFFSYFFIWPLWWLFYFFGAGFILAGFIVLILGVVGLLI